MPSIQITKTHQLPLPTVKKQIDLLNKDLGEKYEIKTSWLSDTKAKVERAGVKGEINISENQVAIHLDLSFALTPFKGKIETQIKEELERLLSKKA